MELVRWPYLGRSSVDFTGSRGHPGHPGAARGRPCARPPASVPRCFYCGPFVPVPLLRSGCGGWRARCWALHAARPGVSCPPLTRSKARCHRRLLAYRVKVRKRVGAGASGSPPATRAVAASGRRTISRAGCRQKRPGTDQKRAKHTTAGIRTWSPTVLLVRRFAA